MGFRCGIVGLPNVGKSTLFNALTETAAAQAANYPFCTIEPNVGRRCDGRSLCYLGENWWAGAQMVPVPQDRGDPATAPEPIGLDTSLTATLGATLNAASRIAPA